MMDHQWVDVEIHPNTLGGKHGPDGRYYMPFGFLQPLIAVPFLLAGRWLESVFSVQYLPFFSVTWLNWISCGILSSLMFVSFRLLKVPRNVALILSLSLIFSTPFWIYSQTFFSEPLTAVLSLLAWLLMYQAYQTGHSSLLLASGFCAGSITCIRPLGGLIIPALMLYALLHEKKISGPRMDIRSFLRRIAAFAVPALAGIGMYLAYNHVRFGSIFETGYDKLPNGEPRSFTLAWETGMRILLVSPGKSIFIFAPLLVLVPFGILLWLRREEHRREAIVSLLAGALYLVVLSRWTRVDGGVSWGPRLIIPVFPLLYLALTPLSVKSKGLMAWSIFFLASAGFMIQTPGNLVNFSTHIHRNPASYYNPADGSYNMSFNPVAGHLSELSEYLRNLPELRQRPEHEAQINRAMEQINPDGILDIWWIYMWLDRVPNRLIAIILSVLLTMFVTGTSLIICGIRSRAA